MKMSKKCVAMMAAALLVSGFGSQRAFADTTLDSNGNVLLGNVAYKDYASYSVVIGTNDSTDKESYVSGYRDTNIGVSNRVEGNEILAAGTANVVYGNTGTTALGYNNTVDLTNYETWELGKDATALGNSNYVSATNAIAMGTENNATGENAVALGTKNTASGESAIAIGTGGATGKGAVAIGLSTYAGAENAVAIGANASNSTAGTVSFGHKKGDKTGFYKDENGNTATTQDDTYTEALTYDTDSFSRLTNVANGTDDNDAATYGQLKTEKTAREDADKELQENLNQVAATRLAGDNYLNSRIDSVEKDANKGIAKATALAALHPLDYDPDNKFDVAAAGGFYKGENAFALGAFYRPSRNVMLSLATTVSSGDNAYNVGVTFKVGKSGKHAEGASTAELYAMIEAMQKRIADLEAAQGK